jgi:hypothetical protein
MKEEELSLTYIKGGIFCLKKVSVIGRFRGGRNEGLRQNGFIGVRFANRINCWG